jgi:hypothetical protein
MPRIDPQPGKEKGGIRHVTQQFKIAAIGQGNKVARQ